MFKRRNCIIVLFFILCIGSCAKERPPINQVQPNYLDKVFFIGSDFKNPSDDPEFIVKETIIDVPFGTDSPWLMRGTDALAARIKWQITEDFLFGRLAYEEVTGTDGKGIGKMTEDGKIILAFAIKKHFDIAKDYNSTTGEEINVIVENDYDRPWYERRYMRVDFSQNLSKTNYNFDVMAQSTILYGTEWESIAYNITDPNDPFAPYFDLDNGYFDITVKAIAKPKILDLTYLGWGEWIWPACWASEDFGGGTYPWGSCNPSEVAIRISFFKVKDSDYEVFPWDGVRDWHHGNIWAYYIQRFGYAHNYGMTDDQWYHFAGRFNIWERSHYYTDFVNMKGEIPCNTSETTPYGLSPNRDEIDQNGEKIPNGTADECEKVGQGSQCDIIKHRCTLPYRSRQLKTIPYYYSNYSPPHLFESSRKALHEWDVALRIAVQSARYSECMYENRLAGNSLLSSQQKCVSENPVIFGSQSENRDAVELAWEFENCMLGLIDPKYKGDRKRCESIIDEIAKKRNYTEQVRYIAKMNEIFVLCHTPVEADDPEICAPYSMRLPSSIKAKDCYEAKMNGDKSILEICNNAFNVRMGDLRYNQIIVFNDPEIYGAWGVGPCTSDPLTGETISCVSYIWNDVTDYYSQYYIDILRYMNGELSTEEVTQGTDVEDWSKAAQASKGVGPTFTKEELENRFAQFSKQHNIDLKAPLTNNESLISALKKNRMKLSKTYARVNNESTSQLIYKTRLNNAKGTEFEAKLINEPIKTLFGIKGMDLTENILEAFSPLRGGNPINSRKFNNLVRFSFGKRGICFFDGEAMVSSPFGVVGLSEILQQKFGRFNPYESKEAQHIRAEKMRKYLAEKWHFTIVAHELGHNMGLSHNFVTSADAFSYWPQYWQLRTIDGKVTKSCDTFTPNGKLCIGPRYFDPITEEEKKNIIWMWGSGSVMDYPGEVTADTLGLGPYDFSAIRSFYGDVASVFSEYTIDSDVGRALAMKNFDQFGGLLGLHPYTTCDKDWYCEGDDHYTRMQTDWKLIRNCKEVNPSDYISTGYNEEKYGIWDPIFDGWLVDSDGDGIYTKCETFPIDYVPYRTLVKPTEKQSGTYYSWFQSDYPILDMDGRVRVPWANADDLWADIGNASVSLHDSGADIYEITNFWISQKEVSHIFRNYRRNRAIFSIREAVDRELWRYDWKLSDIAKGLALVLFSVEDTTAIFRESLSSAWPLYLTWYKDNIIGATNVFDYFTLQAQRPQAGYHGYNYTAYDPVLRSIDDSTSLNYYLEKDELSNVRIPNGATGKYAYVAPAGRILESRLDSSEGNYSQETVLNAGSYYSKIFVPTLLSYSEDNFIPEYWENYYDGRRNNMSYADLFPDGYRRFVGNFLTNDDVIKGARIGANRAKSPEVYKDKYPKYGIGFTTWWTETPKTCFPTEETTICQVAWDNSEIKNKDLPKEVVPIDPQFGWEAQKFLIASTILYIPENEQQRWLDQLRIWELGKDADPSFKERIEFHDPLGKIYIAKTFGKEIIFDKEVQKGIAARVLEYANELLKNAYEYEEVYYGDPKDGNVVGYKAKINPTTGEPQVKWDKIMTGKETCSKDDNSGCVCEDNSYCIKLKKYSEIPAYIREALEAYKIAPPETVGIY